ncbi:protein NDRG2-like isoform X3 [Columba livia]|uniref:protein NDRG2-like isoform X3 n=1 Tax=Columba livia TaxID=8932 RepID=UPI0031BA5D98
MRPRPPSRGRCWTRPMGPCGSRGRGRPAPPAPPSSPSRMWDTPVSAPPTPGRLGPLPGCLGPFFAGFLDQTCFAPLFAHEEMQEIVRNFLLVHVDPPGMEDGAPPYPPGYQYPSLDQLAELLPLVLERLNVATIIGIGVGAGAFVLAKFALQRPLQVEGLVLVNLDPKARGWMDWAAHKLMGLTASTNELILGHLFSQAELALAPPPVRQLRERLEGAPNAGLLWAMYNSRGDLGLERSGAGSLRCPVLLVVGDGSPHEDAAVECNAKLDPTQTSFLKMADGGGQPQITQPAKLTEAFKYFVQGMGYMATSTMTRLSRSRTASLCSVSSGGGGDNERGRSRTLSRGSVGGGARDTPPPP